MKGKKIQVPAHNTLLERAEKLLLEIDHLKEDYCNIRYYYDNLQYKIGFINWINVKIREYKLIEGVHYDIDKVRARRGRCHIYWLDKGVAKRIIEDIIIREMRKTILSSSSSTEYYYISKNGLLIKENQININNIIKETK